MTQTVKNLPAMQETQADPWVRKIPRERNGYPLQYSCHLFLISSASVRSITFLSFMEPIFA